MSTSLLFYVLSIDPRFHRSIEAQTPTGYPDSSARAGRGASYASDVFRTALGSDADDGGRTGVLCNTGATECSGHGQCCHRFVEWDRGAEAWTQRFVPDNDLCGDEDQLSNDGGGVSTDLSWS